MSKREVEKKLEDQHRQILLYEKKLKDVVRAYKSLEAEKNALQAVVESLETDKPVADEDTTVTPNVTEGESPQCEEGKLANLKQALATLTKEKIRRESAFQNDKKALLTENDALKERLRKTADENEDQAEKLEKIIKDLSSKVKKIEADRERELTDHGSVLAEMQQRYAKEKISAEGAHKQLVELYKKLQDKDDLPNIFKTKEKDLQDENSRLKAQLEEWKNKAARTPTVQLLQDQLANTKTEHARDIEEALSRGKQSSQEDKNTVVRMTELEATAQRLTERVAFGEREKFESLEALKKAQDENRDLSERIQMLESSYSCKPSSEDACSQLRSLASDLANKGVNIFDHVGADPLVAVIRSRLERVEDDFEKYKLKAEAVLKAKATTAVESHEDSGLRVLVGQLHDKLRNLEVSHSSDQAQYEQTTRNMRERISELERSEELCRNEMRKEMQHRISEMEIEMQKQRNRTLDVLAEKERELEVTRSILVSLRTEQLGCAPSDPPQTLGKIHSKRKSSDVKKYVDRRISSGSRRSVDCASVCSADFITSSDANNISFPNVNESRNIFYEDELAKKDREVQEMRNSLHQLDYRMREMEQSTLCKDLQNHEMAEKLKEEIRILEGKLKLISTGGEMEYMRNIFVQYLNCHTTSGGNNILKAIGMVLKLSPNEMKAIDKK